MTPFEKTSAGEHARRAIVEIVRVPTSELVDPGPERGAGADAVLDREFADLLYEIGRLVDFSDDPVVAWRTAWLNTAVSNQPHSHQIRLFLLPSVLGTSQQQVSRTLDAILAAIVETIGRLGYDYALVDEDEWQRAIRAAGLGDRGSTEIRALVPDEWLETFPLAACPEVPAFTRIDGSSADLDRLRAMMSSRAGIAITMDAIPTRLTSAESSRIDDIATRLGIVGRGVYDKEVGVVASQRAIDVARTYDSIVRDKNDLLFAYVIGLYGVGSEAVDAASARLLSAIRGSTDSFQHLARAVEIDPMRFSLAAAGALHPWQLSEAANHESRDERLWNRPGFASLRRLPLLATADRLAGIVRLPSVELSRASGFEFNDVRVSSRNYSSGVVGDADVVLGSIRSPARTTTVGLRLNDVTKHAFVCGTPGSGKTTFTLGFLETLWRQHGIPFVVVEPAKHEYRALIDLIPDLQVFTPGREDISPFVLNPFQPPENVTLQEHKSGLKTAFEAAVSMVSPLDRLFEDATDLAYNRAGWLESDTSESGNSDINIEDFIDAFRHVVDAVGYTGEALNVGRAGEVRLRGLARTFRSYQAIPVRQIMTAPTVIELSGIENADEKALYMALLLLRINSYAAANLPADGQLKHVIVIEEAHVLLDSGRRAVLPGEADPGAVARSLVSNMLAEVRAFGIGMVIADQSPRRVGPDVVGLTNLKVAFRLVERDDREIIANATGMEDAEMARLSRLRTGEALTFFDRLDVPEHIVTPDHRERNGIRVSIEDEEIRRRMTYWSGNSDLLVPFPECAFVDGWDPESAPRTEELARQSFLTAALAINTVDKSAAKAALDDVAARVVKSFDEPNPIAFQMAHVYLLRMLRYQTAVPISADTVRVTLEGAVRRSKNAWNREGE